MFSFSEKFFNFLEIEFCKIRTPQYLRKIEWNIDKIFDKIVLQYWHNDKPHSIFLVSRERVDDVVGVFCEDSSQLLLRQWRLKSSKRGSWGDYLQELIPLY